MEVYVSPTVIVFQVLTVAISLTALTFIALVLFLDRKPTPLPMALPDKD